MTSAMNPGFWLPGLTPNPQAPSPQSSSTPVMPNCKRHTCLLGPPGPHLPAPGPCLSFAPAPASDGAWEPRSRGGSLHPSPIMRSCTASAHPWSSPRRAQARWQRCHTCPLAILSGLQGAQALCAAFSTPSLLGFPFAYYFHQKSISRHQCSCPWIPPVSSASP